MIEWLNQRYHTRFSDADLEEIKNFSLIWNVFEGKYLSADFSIGGVETILQRRVIDANQFAESLTYFRNRYTDNGRTNYRFPFLHFRKGDKQSLVEDVLTGVNNDDNAITLALVIIVYRYRNNLFHGLKEFEEMNEQVENFQQANRFLMTLINNFPT